MIIISGIPGLYESLSAPDSGVVSIYSIDYSAHAWKVFDNFNQGGRAIFTMASTPVKCAGAPLKIMFLFEELMRNKKNPITNIEYWTPGIYMCVYIYVCIIYIYI
jgi:sulfide:quinone oxidoreductase